MHDDDPVVIDNEKPLRLSAAAMDALHKATGRTMTELMGDDSTPEAEAETDRLRVMAFAELFRRNLRLGHMPDAATLWERAYVVDLEFAAPTTPDFLDGESSETSPPFAGTGE